MDQVSIPDDLKITPAIISEYNILNSTLVYSHIRLGTATYEVTTKAGNFLLKLIAPNSQTIIPKSNSKLCAKYIRLMRGSNLLALKCSQLVAFPKVVSHKATDKVLQILMMVPGQSVIDYAINSNDVRLKDLMNITAQTVNAILDLNKLNINHYVISLKAVYLTPSKRICITEIFPDISSFISYNDAIAEEDGFQLPPEPWGKEGKGMNVSSHIYVMGHHFLKLMHSNPCIINYIQSITSRQASALMECTEEQLSLILNLINRMVDIQSISRPTPQELLFYFKLFSLGNSDVAVQISISFNNLYSEETKNRAWR